MQCWPSNVFQTVSKRFILILSCGSSSVHLCEFMMNREWSTPSIDHI
uniref:Uncharacterized protein n=1 Tax=Anguilla anguilla TaxID=7936 RepID=A0A0E9Q5B9_ANGAN